MSEKDNIKLKTDTLSSRKSSASVGVHVKRKRKIIAKPASKDSLKKNDVSVVKKEDKNFSPLKKTNNEKKVKTLVEVSEAQKQNIKHTKKQHRLRVEKSKSIFFCIFLYPPLWMAPVVTPVEKGHVCPGSKSPQLGCPKVHMMNGQRTSVITLQGTVALHDRAAAGLLLSQ